ncbi:hypothetical protein TKK_0017771 [Trichogramma kaykai]|uniref:Spaetzle domain-containing protein n=1 Tax=Trichogramma kaykai TaxID=54128 RepID=A0ABD2W1D3_9HYME
MNLFSQGLNVRLLLIFLILISSKCTGIERGWRRWSRDDTSDLKFPEKSVSTRYGDGGDAADNIDKIVFPTDDVVSVDQPQSQQQQSPSKFVPRLAGNCEKSTFCEFAPNYPKDFVETNLRINSNKFLPSSDVVPNVVHRFNAGPEDASLCDSHETVVYPKVAQNKNNEWLFVVNHGNFTQGVRVETCVNENAECNLIEGFVEGYKTVCKQKYIYRQLVAVLPAGQIKQEMFRFPASCCCHIKFAGNSFMRFGGGGGIAAGGGSTAGGATTDRDKNS